jgi:trans-AT polyketide synthase, acyltransferase and oxidoreductase domains
MNHLIFKNDLEQIQHCAREFRTPCVIVKNKQDQKLYMTLLAENKTPAFEDYEQDWQIMGYLPATYPEWLGSKQFLKIHGARFPYIVGEMANGIATADMVIAAVKSGFMGFFGAAGLMPKKIEENILKIKRALTNNETNWGSNLIYMPNEPGLEEKVVETYLHHEVHRVSTSAYMSLSPHLVHFSAHGLSVDHQGVIRRKNYVLAKLSRPELAELFMKPAPEKILNLLVSQHKISHEEAQLAKLIPVAQDITVEADSGGHTDNRPLPALLPRILMLANQYHYDEPIRVGAAGGLGCPMGVSSAFAMGADYVLTGTINQSAVEAGLSLAGKELLAQADIADVVMAPAADMFELGVKLQVLKRGCLFANRARKLYELYTHYKDIRELPDAIKHELEKNIFKRSLTDVWHETQKFFNERDPQQIIKAEENPHYQMALIFRWYLGLSSAWAIQGTADRVSDYQIWCGPAIGSFNQWVAGSFLEPLANRSVEQIGKNLLEGTSYINRLQQLSNLGLYIPTKLYQFTPRMLR